MCFKRAYDVVLRHHHSFVIRSVVTVCVAAPHVVPRRPPPMPITIKISIVIFDLTPIAQVAIHAVPRRDDFFTRIAQGGSVEKLDIELAKWLIALDALIVRLSAFLRDGNYGCV